MAKKQEDETLPSLRPRRQAGRAPTRRSGKAAGDGRASAPGRSLRPPGPRAWSLPLKLPRPCAGSPSPLGPPRSLARGGGMGHRAAERRSVPGAGCSGCGARGRETRRGGVRVSQYLYGVVNLVGETVTFDSPSDGAGSFYCRGPAEWPGRRAVLILRNTIPARNRNSS
ncbi:hypothetical protein U9M48_004503 [Paspalum notatum var. saurae]|uniref:Uncharacterized protein n=1 Tax=Paspalum notatum var. saurae TaxID=547442 RepID=A0AAQ3PN48_PASNO